MLLTGNRFRKVVLTTLFRRTSLSYSVSYSMPSAYAGFVFVNCRRCVMSYYRFLLASALVPAAFFAFPSSPEAAALSYGHTSAADYTHTHTSTLSAEPASRFIDMAHSYKTAAVCFLGYGDCDPNVGFGSGGENYSVDSAQQCLNEGFSRQNCSSLQAVDEVCPYNSAYGKGCKCASNLVTCPAGQVGVGESCGGKYASCQCDPALVSCASNQTGQGASCGGKYQSCVCKSEYQYNSSNCTSPRSVSGESCGGKYTGCVCPSGVSAGTYGCAEYYGSPCSSVCKTAYTDNCHNRNDNNSAVYGCMKYWDDCSTKCETPYTDNCRNRTAVISGCPTNATCTYFSDCSAKISGWSCDSGYKASGNSCVIETEPCNVGSIYYADGTCLSAENHNADRTVLGIVVYMNPNGVGGQIMAPWPINKYGNKSSSEASRVYWALGYIDILDIPNYTDSISASQDYDSCGNTDKIVAQCDARYCEAAWAVRKYYVTDETYGKWCLPAAGILENIYNNQDAIQTAIAKVGGVEYSGSFSSSESNYAYVWYYGLSSIYKNTSGDVYPVLEF